MAKNKKDISVSEAIKTIDSFPSMESSDYAHGSWAQVAAPKADRVLTQLTLDQVTKAFVSGEELDIKYVVAHKVRFVSSYDYSSKERDFLLENEAGGLTAALTITEALSKAKVKVESITKIPARRTYGNNANVAEERWSAVLVEFGSTEHNYNAGYSDWEKRIKVTRDGDSITWRNAK